jgi:hypothetical protein
MFAPLQFTQFSLPPPGGAAGAFQGRLSFHPEGGRGHHPYQQHHQLAYQPAKVGAGAGQQSPGGGGAIRRDRQVMRRKSRETNTTYLWEFLLKLLQVRNLNFFKQRNFQTFLRNFQVNKIAINKLTSRAIQNEHFYTN